MNKFTFSYPTKVYFGEGSAAQAFAAELGKVGENVMLAYGGGSVKKNTQFGMINNRANKKYKCSCEDIQRINLVKYFIQSKLCQLSIITLLN